MCLKHLGFSMRW